MSAQEYKHIVRIMGNDIPGDKKLVVGLSQIRGVGRSFATAILDILKINQAANIGYISDADVEAIEKILKDPLKSGVPSWFLNRRKDIETGEDKHVLTSDVAFYVRNDIEREKGVGSWRGYRHMYGLKVRGQRTRTTGRKGGAVGVAKGGKAQPAKGGDAAAAAPAAAAPAAGAEAPKEEAAAAAKPAEEAKK